jgi:hypothetical protein
LLLIAVAIALLVLGLANGSSGLLVGSIGTSLLAAVALIVGARQAAAARAEAEYREEEQTERDDYDEPRERRSAVREPMDLEPEPLVRGRAERPVERPDRSHGLPERGDTATITIPAQGSGAVDVVEDDEDPPDEPMPQRVLPADAARVARMTTDVLVIDGRPRYHMAGCVHLLGRPHEPLPVGEAVELGFTPCGLCEPDSALLADARRV